MKKKKIFWGIILILAACLILLNGLGYFEDIGVIKILFTCIFAGLTVKGIAKISFPLILFPIAFIGIMYSKQLGIDDLTPWPILLIALLLSIGLSLIFKKDFDKKHIKHFYFSNKNKTKEFKNKEDSSINFSVAFGSAIKYVNTNDFNNVNIECSFGGMKVYFDNAIITGNSANIDLDLAFGSVELYVPKDWNIIQQTDSSFGGVDYKNTANNTSTGPNVYINGEIAFAGLTIIYI